MIFKKMDFESIDNGERYCLSIVISGNNPELMITESTDLDEIETVQVDSEITHTLYLALHNIYSAKP